MKVVDVTTHVLLDPGFDLEATSSAQDTIVVEVTTDEGFVGIGETDLNAWIARACIEAPGTHTMDRGLKQMLIGRDPLDPEAVWNDLYVGSAMSGRRGAVVHALGALDMALWDICGKAAGVPCWQLWGETDRTGLTPYASLQPEVEAYEAYVESMVGWATCTPPWLISTSKSWRVESHSPAAIRTGEQAESSAYPATSSVHSGVSRKKTSNPSHDSITRSARSTVSKAYWTSTMIVISGPTASRTAATTSVIRSSGPTRPL